MSARPTLAELVLADETVALLTAFENLGGLTPHTGRTTRLWGEADLVFTETSPGLWRVDKDRYGRRGATYDMLSKAQFLVTYALDYYRPGNAKIRLLEIPFK